MTEDEARAWVAERFGAEAVERLSAFTALVQAENGRQNLIAASTLETIWVRHLIDSAQLIGLAPAAGQWLDIGTGGGFPGIVVALLRSEPTLLVEPRRLRADFLRRCVDQLSLPQVTVAACRIEQCTAKAAVISARAVAPVEKLLHAARHCATVSTRWLLPRGLFDEATLASIRQHWTGVFHVEQSVTDAASVILVIDGAARRCQEP